MINANVLEYNIAGNDVVAVSGTSAQSAAQYTNTVCVCSTTNCWIKVGSNPTAVANTDANFYLPANILFHISVNSGDKVAVIQDSSSGYLTVTPAGY